MAVLVGRQAPDFTVPAVLGDGSIVEDYNLKNNTLGKYSLVFFYPLDFTFVCPSGLSHWTMPCHSSVSAALKSSAYLLTHTLPTTHGVIPARIRGNRASIIHTGERHHP